MQRLTLASTREANYTRQSLFGNLFLKLNFNALRREVSLLTETKNCVSTSLSATLVGERAAHYRDLIRLGKLFLKLNFNALRRETYPLVGTYKTAFLLASQQP